MPDASPAGTPTPAPQRGASAPDALPDLAEILSAQLDFARTVEAVTTYARRLLDADGAALILAEEDAEGLRVAGADGSLAAHLGTRFPAASGGLVVEAIAIEEPVATAAAAGPPRVFLDVTAPAAVVAPLRAQGITAGALLAVARAGATFGPEDARRLSAVAAHSAVVLANAGLFAMVQRGKRQWEATFDALSEGIAITDGDARILRANAGFAALAGEALPTLVGRPLCVTLFGEHHTLRELMQAARAGTRPSPLVRRSERLGRILRVSAAGIPAEAEAGALVVTVEDITEQKTLEMQLIQSEKMAAVGTLVSGVAHELNNPMTSIAGLAEFLLEQPPGAVADREHLRVIAEEAQRAGSIVRNLLTFARKGPVEREPLAMAAIVERTLFLVAYEMKLKGITAETTVAPGVPPVLGDRHQLQQVVLNLLTNAIQALATLPAGLPRRVAVSVAAERDRVVLRLSDTGLGIPADVLPQIFGPFFTTKPLGEGTGLGLFISYGIVEGHGGTLTVDSRPGSGATFTLTLPAAAGASAAGVAAERLDAAPSAPPGRRILVIDDDQGVRRMVSALFAREGHAVDTAPDGDAGLRFARGADYDLIVVDRRAAAEGGPFLAALERTRPGWGARTIVSTSDVRVPLADAGIPASVHLLRKPFHLRDLRAAAAAVWSAGTPL